MTIKEYYKKMKRHLRSWNRKSNWDETNYCYHIEYHSKKAKTRLLHLLNSDFETIQLNMSLGILSTKQFDEKMKVWNDCSTSISNMEIW